MALIESLLAKSSRARDPEIDANGPLLARRGWVTAAGVLGLAAYSFVVLIGGTVTGEPLPELRLANAVLAAGVILYYLFQAPARADRTDLLILAAVVAFAATGAASQFPRQSLDGVLVALTWAAALFVARRLLAHEPLRATFVRLLVVISATLTIFTALRWLPLIQAWWATGTSLIPPLEFDFPAHPWGHWHDLALLLALLYPAWWAGKPSRMRRSLAVVIGLVVLSIVVVDGSRNTWAAVIVATAALGAPHFVRVVRNFSRRQLLVIGGVIAITFAALAVAVGGALVAHAFDLANLQYRASMWESLLRAWLSHPIFGSGPGSFPWILQRTGYFDTNSLAPRHPDSAVFQLLGEGGLLGLIALGLVLAALLPVVLQGRSAVARWSLTAFAVACLAANPTDFAFLVMVGVGWTAFTAPNVQVASDPIPPRAARRRFVRMATLACLTVVGLTSAVTLAAAFSYGQARDSIAANRLADAAAQLDAAVNLDPGMALYIRQRGALHYLLGDSRSAIADLSRATAMNASDDLGWRTLALAQATAGLGDEEKDSIERAVSTQRSDPANLLLLARWEGAHGDSRAAAATLAEIVEAWPAIIASPRWSDLLPPLVSSTAIVDDAVARWQRGDLGPVPFAGQGMWLAILGDRPDLLPRALDASGTSSFLARATVSVFRCDPTAAAQLNAAPASERGMYLYWLLRLRTSAFAEIPDRTAATIIRVWGGPTSASGETETLNPMNENDPHGFSADAWGYRRSPIDWPLSAAPSLPSPQAGEVRWLFDPSGAMHQAGVKDRLPRCH